MKTSKTDELIQEIVDLLREPAKPGSLHPAGCAARWSVKPLFAWYDCWVGIFWDSRKRKLYILPIPCVGVVIEFPMRHNDKLTDRDERKEPHAK